MRRVFAKFKAFPLAGACFLSFLAIAVVAFLVSAPSLQAHEGHHAPFQQVEPAGEKVLLWLGLSHLVALHFPIALVGMAVLAEFLYFWNRSPLFSHAARFMVMSTAFIAIPTVLFGFALSYRTEYGPELASVLWWHCYLGVATMIVAIATAFFMEAFGRAFLYYASLFLLFLTVNATGFFGGDLSFRISALLFPGR